MLVRQLIKYRRFLALATSHSTGFCARIAFQVVVPFYILGAYGESEFASFVMAFAISGFLQVLDLGYQQYTSNVTTSWFRRPSRERYASQFCATTAFLYVVVALMLMAGVLVFYIGPYTDHDIWAMAILGISGILAYARGFLRGPFRALGFDYEYVAVQTVSQLTGVGAVILVSQTGNSFIVFSIVFATLYAIVPSIVLVFLINRHFKIWTVRPLAPSRILRSNHRRSARGFMSFKLGNIFLNHGPVLAIGAIPGATPLLVDFSVVRIIVNSVGRIVDRVGQLLAVEAEFQEYKNRNKFKRTYLFRGLGLIGALMVFIWGVVSFGIMQQIFSLIDLHQIINEQLFQVVFIGKFAYFLGLFVVTYYIFLHKVAYSKVYYIVACFMFGISVSYGVIMSSGYAVVVGLAVAEVGGLVGLLGLVLLKRSWALSLSPSR